MKGPNFIINTHKAILKKMLKMPSISTYAHLWLLNNIHSHPVDRFLTLLVVEQKLIDTNSSINSGYCRYICPYNIAQK